MEKINFQKLIPGVAGPIFFALIILFVHPEGLSDQANAVLATTTWIAIWWVFEVTDISVTALLPIILFPLSGALDIKSTSASYGDKFIFLYMGGFMLAIAIEKWNLHRRIALTIIRVLGTGISKIMLGFMVATAFLSMWISNTATSVMMLPIGVAIINQMKDHPDTKQDEHSVFGKALMLAIAYSASIGGMATLIGTPPNLVLAGVVQELYNVELGFMQWFMFGFPISVTLLIICWIYLTKYAFKFPTDNFPGGRGEVLRLLKELGNWRYEEKMVLSIFVATASLWICRSYIQQVIPAIDDTIIALTAALSLFIIPSTKKKERLLMWKEAVKLPWGIIILFGGGMAIAQGFKDSGLTEWVGSQFTLFNGLPIFLIIFVLIMMVNFLTEITSNLATTAMLLPILAPIAIALDLHPYILLVSATVAASCAFMLPVATPPNAVVFGSGYLRIPDMIRAGIWMNLLSIVILSIFVYFGLELIWGIN